MPGGKRTRTVSVRSVTQVGRAISGKPVFELRTSGGTFRTSANSSAADVLAPMGRIAAPVRLTLELNGHGTVDSITGDVTG